MRVETERMYLYPLSDEEMRLVIENESDSEMKQAYTEMLEGVFQILIREYGMQSGIWN